MWKLRYSLFLLPVFAYAQPVVQRTLGRADSVSAWVPRSLIVSAEVGDLLQPLWCKCGRSTQVALQLLLRDVFLEGQGGYVTRLPVALPRLDPNAPKRSEEIYQNIGYFWRTGISLRLNPRHATWISSLGASYGQANYDERIRVTLYNPLDSAATRSVVGTLATQRLKWYGVHFSLKTRVWKGIMLGYRIRLAFRPRKIREHIDVLSAYAPGYGYLNKNAQFWVNYYVGYQIPFFKQKKPLKKARNR